MIERWFPCAEVSANSDSGWGSGNQERNLFTWFAARPTAQAKAAVICSLLPWPVDEGEQRRLQDLVRRAMTGRYEAWGELREEILKANPDGASVLDPFSGRGMIPLEAARLGIPSYGIDYSPVAVLAAELLTDYPFRDWSEEPPLPFDEAATTLIGATPRLIRDVETVFTEVGRRYYESMAEFYPKVDGKQPWGYLWAVTLPCQECNRRFPLVASFELRKPSERKATRNRPQTRDAGQAFYIDVDRGTGTFCAVVHEGSPRHAPTFVNAIGPDGRKVKGKSAVCPFCGHTHPIATHQRLAGEGAGQDALLVVVEPNDDVGRFFREPTDEERAAIGEAKTALQKEADFGVGVPALPLEDIPLNNGATIRPQLYGASTYGDLMTDRQSLAFVRLSRCVNEMTRELKSASLGHDYVRALSGYAAAVLVRMLKFSTRGAKMRSTPGAGLIDHIFANEGTIAFSYDFFEAGLSDGPGSWSSMSTGTARTLDVLMPERVGTSVVASQGSATSLPFRSQSIAAVVTDPPYDAMVYYTDSSDFFFCWLKRALAESRPELVVTPDSRGLQDKTEEIIVKEHGKAPGEHRNREHYDTKITQAFAEMNRVVRDDGLVTIVFGHGEPEVWQRLLGSIQSAGLVMTGSWPANTESGGQQGKANIETTLTMSCRPGQAGRPEGRRGGVEAEIKTEIRMRYPDWERWGLAPTDMLMAAAGPAMEVVGRYSEVLDARGESVDISSFLPLARAAVQEAMAVEIDHHPLETFDARTRFALWWVRLFNRNVTAKSELRWQSLAASLDVAEIRDLVPDTDKGCAFVTASKHKADIGPESSVIDVALALGRSSDQGLEAMGDVLVASARAADDAYLWAALKFLADRLQESDPDAIAFTRVLRSRSGLGNVVQAMEAKYETAAKKQASEDAQLKLM
jgi:putative DNA methylase